MIDSRLKILAVLPVLIVVASALLVNVIDLEHLILRPGHRQLLNFSPQTNLLNFETDGKSSNADIRSMTQRKSVSAIIEYDVPSVSVSRPFQKEDVMTNEVSHNANINPKLTFVVLNGRRSFAILDDRLLHEGESTGGMTIQKIEKERILIKDKTLRWIYMEEER